jgi:hypothetical protein
MSPLVIAARVSRRSDRCGGEGGKARQGTRARGVSARFEPDAQRLRNGLRDHFRACRIQNSRLPGSKPPDYAPRSGEVTRPAGAERLFLVLILASGFFPTLMRIMSSLVQLSANHPGRLIGLDCRFVSGLPDLSCRRIRVRMPLFSGFMRTAGAQGN